MIIPNLQTVVIAAVVVALLIAGCVLEHWRGRKRASEPPPTPTRLLATAIGLLVFFFAVTARYAQARDLDGRYATSPLKPWFNQLKSSKGLCCSVADGRVVEDPDWESHDGHYRVRIDGEWIDVPDDAVITEPNRAGRTMVWPMRGSHGMTVRCFMPGPMT